jgi:hypothetical protein
MIHKGFFAFANIKRVDGADGKSLPYVCVVATTRNLMQRFCTTSVCQLDGGFKYNVLDWPCVLLGATNPNMHFAPCGILWTSTLKKPQVREGLCGFSSQILAVARSSPAKLFVMADSEEALRHGACEAFSAENTPCQPLMCWFHVKAAVTSYVNDHARVENKLAFRKAICADFDLIQQSRSLAEFNTRISAVKQHWLDERYAEATQWQDKKGKIHNILTYAEEQWFSLRSEWHFGPANSLPTEARQRGMCLPTTNNGNESEIKWSRLDAGGLPASALQCTVFVESG